MVSVLALNGTFIVQYTLSPPEPYKPILQKGTSVCLVLELQNDTFSYFLVFRFGI